MALTATALAVIVLYLLYRLLKQIPGWLRRLLRWLTSLLSFGNRTDGGAGYEDDVERLMHWKDFGDRLKGRLQDFLARRPSAPKWEDLTDNKQRIRFLYRDRIARAIRSGAPFRPSLTPKEAVREWERSGSDGTGGKTGAAASDAKLVDVYERVRYGERTVSDAEVAELKKSVDSER
ncbi:DUF4129 domain-containing protein [Paenibacillus sp. P26]|nr:DUF4129 domain-containing protein [Paenibacillus sp. P26]